MATNNRQTIAYQKRLAAQDALRASNSAVSGLMPVILGAIAKQVAQSVVGDVRQEVQIFASLTGGAITRNRETRLKRLHTDVAQEGLDAITLAYEARADRGVHSANYRPNTRYSGGKLLRALQSDEMFTVGRDGFDFINQDHLDKEAKQWRRMNFGAGPRGSRTPKAPSAKMQIFGGTTPVDLALTNTKPSDQYLLPPGFWLDQATGKKQPWDKSRRPFKDSFGPTGKEPIYKSMGFAGSRFLDAGVAQIAKSLPIAYNDLFNEWFTEYKRTGGGPVVNEKVKFNPKQIAAYLDKENLRLQGAVTNLRGSL